MSLSDKEVVSIETCIEAYYKSDVREHVRELKDRMDKYRTNNDLWRLAPAFLLDDFLDLIDEVFGEDLI